MQLTVKQYLSYSFLPSGQNIYIQKSADTQFAPIWAKLYYQHFIESVTSVGPMEPKRLKEIEEMSAGTTAGKIYITAFPDFKTFKKFFESLAWKTEVWIANMPERMIYLNDDKFLGPRKPAGKH